MDRAAYFLAEQTQDYLPDSVISDFYHLADALLLPSREEGFGIPILEAGLTGMPIFCADIPSLRELGGEEVSYFSPDADPTEVARMIAQALSAESEIELALACAERIYLGEDFQAHIAPLLST